MSDLASVIVRLACSFGSDFEKDVQHSSALSAKRTWKLVGKLLESRPYNHDTPVVMMPPPLSVETIERVYLELDNVVMNTPMLAFLITHFDAFTPRMREKIIEGYRAMPLDLSRGNRDKIYTQKALNVERILNLGDRVSYTQLDEYAKLVKSIQEWHNLTDEDIKQEFLEQCVNEIIELAQKESDPLKPEISVALEYIITNIKTPRDWAWVFVALDELKQFPSLVMLSEWTPEALPPAMRARIYTEYGRLKQDSAEQALIAWKLCDMYAHLPLLLQTDQTIINMLGLFVRLEILDGDEPSFGLNLVHPDFRDNTMRALFEVAPNNEVIVEIQEELFSFINHRRDRIHDKAVLKEINDAINRTRSPETPQRDPFVRAADAQPFARRTLNLEPHAAPERLSQSVAEVAIRLETDNLCARINSIYRSNLYKQFYDDLRLARISATDVEAMYRAFVPQSPLRHAYVPSSMMLLQNLCSAYSALTDYMKAEIARIYLSMDATNIQLHHPRADWGNHYSLLFIQKTILAKRLAVHKAATNHPALRNDVFLKAIRCMAPETYDVNLTEVKAAIDAGDEQSPAIRLIVQREAYDPVLWAALGESIAAFADASSRQQRIIMFLLSLVQQGRRNLVLALQYEAVPTEQKPEVLQYYRALPSNTVKVFEKILAASGIARAYSTVSPDLQTDIFLCMLAVITLENTFPLGQLPRHLRNSVVVNLIKSAEEIPPDLFIVDPPKLFEVYQKLPPALGDTDNASRGVKRPRETDARAAFADLAI